MGRIGDTLTTSERTLRNTQPYADLEFKSLDPYLPSFPIAVGRQLEFNVYFTNIGNDTANHVYEDVKFYIEKLDDDAAQRRIVADFDKWWLSAKHPSGPIRPNAPAFQSFKTGKFTDDEFRDLQSRTKTLYVLIRFTYSDRTARWVGDECFAMQNPTNNLSVGHPCLYHINHRYRAAEKK